MRKLLDCHSEAICIQCADGLTLNKKYRYFDTHDTGHIDIQNDNGEFVTLPISLFDVDTTSASLWGRK